MQYLIVGAGTSGLGAAGLCKKLGQKVVVYDKDAKKLISLKQAKLIDEDVALCHKLSNSLVHNTDCIVLSPGVVLSQKTQNQIKKENKMLVGELEFGMQYAKGTQIAITGTNGKTTTTELCAFVLAYAKKSSKKVGNIGISVCDVAQSTTDDDFLVCEASSFQLENAKSFHPHIACFLNFASDHLDRYKTMQDYLNAKLHIFDNMDAGDFAVLNFDDKVVCGCSKNLKAKTFFVSATKKLDFMPYSAWFLNDIIFVKTNSKIDEIELINPKLKGVHNIYNMMFASVVCILCGVDSHIISQAFDRFLLPSHRCEFVANQNGVVFVDDSKATNVHATLSAVGSFDGPIVLLLGGSDKKEDFSVLFKNLPKNVKSVITFGKSGKKLQKIAKKHKFFDVEYVFDFCLAVDKAKQKAVFGDTVLLSPACASFDAFSSYAQRGDCFKYLITGEKIE